MFKPLDNLESLLLHSTDLIDLPRNLLTNFRKLRKLNLHDNSIHTLDHSSEIFGNMTSLKFLDLSSNLISIMNKTSLPSTLLNSLEQINLEANPFSCTCDQKWFLEWIKQTKTTNIMHSFSTVMLIENGENVFLRKMEKDEGIKLCIHQRDFDIGKPITRNIDKYLQKSWKVVVVMSNNFAKSEWCQWEVDVVQERRRRQGKGVFLLIMLKTINSKHMTSPLRTLLESTPHIRYQTGVGENLFWRAAVKCLKKPLGHPPVAVL
ncbi:toll-like receptor 1 [Mytilus californianus]|uniref:toll-like receptor 1 n=1 Tax=Mytilus californianus TaxID=6549 RepID=UPI00224588B9|nr:toll-like receptor 1 [Mytilus californianus]